MQSPFKESDMFWKSIAALSLAIFGTSAFAADLEGRVLKIGTDATYPPMELIDEATGEIVGFDIDLLNAICAEINCVPNFVNTAWDGIFAALQQGEFDLVVSGVSITEERDKTMDFSDPYLVLGQAIMVRVEDESLTVEDFQNGGLKLASQTGTTNAQLAEELVGRENVSLYGDFSAAVIALQNSDVDGVIIDGTSASAYVQEFAGELSVPITGLKSDALGIVAQEGDAIIDALNEGLAAVKASGKLDELMSKYWDDN